MEFFEFFFSGPDWGWRFLALIFFGSLVASICRAVFPIFTFTKNYHLDNVEEDEDHPATKDDVRT